MFNNRLRTSALFMTFITLVLIPNGWSREVMGVNFPEALEIQGTQCKLQGVGVRKKLIINVYLGALYLTKPSRNASEVVSSDQTKRIVMHFLYKEVKANQLIEAWNEGFTKNSGNAMQLLKDKIELFNGYFTEPIKKGETIVLTYVPGKGTEVIIKNNVKGVIEGKDFMEALFYIWFGSYPPSKGLKEGMLGQ